MTQTSGVVLQGVDRPDEFEAMAEEIEDLGYDHLWLTDSSLHARNPYPYLALAGRRTSRVTLGTAVTNPFTRHPAITAATISTLDDVAPGRAILGIGAGDRPVRALGYGAARLQHMRDTVTAVRALLADEHVTLESDQFSLDDAHIRYETRPDIPIYMSASGPKMLSLAGEIADGVIVLAGLFEAGIRFAIERIEEGAREAGRERPHVAVMAYGAIDEDEDRALADARTIAAWFPQTAPAYCELAGLDPDLIDKVRASYSGGEFQEAADAALLLPDEFVRKVAVAGNRDRITDHLGRARQWGMDSLHVFPLGDRRMDTARGFAHCFRASA